MAEGVSGRDRSGVHTLVAKTLRLRGPPGVGLPLRGGSIARAIAALRFERSGV